jgi:hypothetical protein
LYNLKSYLFLFAVLINITVSDAQQFNATRANSLIILDGKLDEADWKNTDTLGNFMQTDPNPGADATEKTEVRILYNDTYLFIGVHAFDSVPSGLIRLGLERDFSLGIDDCTSFIIDTYNDKSTGTVFCGNTLNARLDEQVTLDGQTENMSYNTFWDVVTLVDSSGYTSEYRIPFSSLRFKSDSVVTMGIRFSRLIKRKNELITFPRIDPKIENGWINVSHAKEVTFLNLKSHKPFYITPYVVATYSQYNLMNDSATGYDYYRDFLQSKHYSANTSLDKMLSNIGVDAKYGISKNFTLDITVNTDFSQVEADDEIINLTKYEINLPEKRSFFLESADNLNFNIPAGGEIFFSRKIGLDNGIIVPIIGGLRLTGKSKGWQIGVLNMQTKDVQEGSILPHNYFVIRTRRDIDKTGSYIGGIFTNNIAISSTTNWSRTIGFDLVKKFNALVSFESRIAGTYNNRMSSSGKNLYYNAGISRNSNEGVNYKLYVDILGPDFIPSIGFIEENNLGLCALSLGYQQKAKGESRMEFIYFRTEESYRWKLSSGLKETAIVNLTPGITFKDGSDINISLFEYKIDSLFTDWALDQNNAIAAATYRMINNSLNYTLPNTYVYSGGIKLTYGDFYGGKRFVIAPVFTYSFSSHFNSNLTYEYNFIRFNKYLLEDRNTVFESNLVRLNLSFMMSVKLSIKLYVQYEDLNGHLSSNLRFRYNPREGNDLYVVFNQGLNVQQMKSDPRPPFVEAQGITIKYLKTFTL